MRHDLLRALEAAHLADAGDAHALDGVLADVQVVSIRAQQVPDVLIVHLQE